MTQGFWDGGGALLLAGGLPALAQSKMVTLAEVAQGRRGQHLGQRHGGEPPAGGAQRRSERSGGVDSRVWQPGEGGDELLRLDSATPAPRWSRRGRNKPEREQPALRLAPSSSAWIACTSKERLPEPV